MIFFSFLFSDFALREAVEVVVRVAERLRDPGRGDLEGAQRRRAGALQAVERARGRRAERDRDQGQRDEDEADDEPRGG